VLLFDPHLKPRTPELLMNRRVKFRRRFLIQIATLVEAGDSHRGHAPNCNPEAGPSIKPDEAQWFSSFEEAIARAAPRLETDIDGRCLPLRMDAQPHSRKEKTMSQSPSPTAYSVQASEGIGACLPFEQINGPGTYVCNWSGHLLRVPEDAVKPGRSPVLELLGKTPLYVTKISDAPFIALTKARMIASNLDLAVDF